MLHLLQKKAKKTVFLFIISLNILLSSIIFAEENISTFDEKWAFNLFGYYNMGIFGEFGSSPHTTDEPWEIGLGLRYDTISASLFIPLSFNQPSNIWPFNFEIDSYFNNVYYEAYFKHYSNMNVQNANDHDKLDIYSSGITATFLHNNKNYSLSSVIKLDKKQNVSGGSLLYGFGFFHSSLHSATDMANKFSDRQNLLYFGPSIGYSYTHIFNNGVFLSTSLVHFSNPTINLNSGKWLYILQLEPKIVVGHHHDTWSMNLNIMDRSAFIIWDKYDLDTLTLFSMSIMFSKRF